MPYTPNSTWANDLAGGTPLSAARLNVIEAGINLTWESWTPTWTCESGSAPAIVNGSLTGRYVQRGKTVIATMTLIAGSSTTFGSGGAWVFSYPVSTAGALGGNIKLLDNAVANYLGLASTRDASTWYPYVWTSAGAYVTATSTTSSVPFAWGNSDRLDAWLVYEAA